ncbi:hypothetical protein GQX74_015569 [Glossina fuscipes]|nr:hypothetical protein GQX74_015569 [Glossina fuscipes]
MATVEYIDVCVQDEENNEALMEIKRIHSFSCVEVSYFFLLNASALVFSFFVDSIVVNFFQFQPPSNVTCSNIYYRYHPVLDLGVMRNPKHISFPSNMVARPQVNLLRIYGFASSFQTLAHIPWLPFESKILIIVPSLTVKNYFEPINRAQSEADFMFLSIFFTSYCEVKVPFTPGAYCTLLKVIWSALNRRHQKYALGTKSPIPHMRQETAHYDHQQKFRSQCSIKYPQRQRSVVDNL